jgi:hypothetical protein
MCIGQAYYSGRRRTKKWYGWNSIARKREAMQNPLLPRAGGIAVVVAVALAVVSLVVLALESRYRSCVDAAEARFPAVAVSAFNTRSTGPVKVSFVRERQRAVDDCHRL